MPKDESEKNTPVVNEVKRYDQLCKYGKKQKRNNKQFFCLSQHLCVLGLGKVNVHVRDVLPCAYPSFSLCLLDDYW